MSKVSKFLTIFFIIFGLTFIFVLFNIFDRSSNFDSDSISSLKLVFGINGLVFIIIGVVIGIIGHMSFVKKKKLRESGRRIDAKIDRVDKDLLSTYNNQHPYILYCYYVDAMTNEKKSFKSEPIWFDIVTLIEMYNINTVPVYLDESNPKKYYVDIEEFDIYKK